MTAMVLDVGRVRPAFRLLRILATWQAVTLYIYLGSRLVSTLLVLQTVRSATPDGVGSHKSVLLALTNWDAVWYARIAAHGYPSVLPIVGDAVQNNAWAFLPFYPMFVKFVVLGNLSLYPIASLIVSTLFGAAAAVMLALLVRPHAGDRAALIAVAAFSLGPSSFILQTGYARLPFFHGHGQQRV